ncbi:DNA cytosine methyltransferase [Micromonospora tarensis]|uniref:DNA cytosine methyltransferase n=1 Tax=Micromonospora tarensis TaxID=2806100 RepID=UPI002815F1DB|nr:DNA cytosine methyltransferase [Micromonospora tarensis]
MERCRRRRSPPSTAARFRGKRRRAPPPRLRRRRSDLATLGYDTSWTCLRASDIGAAHRRDRLFLLATPAEPHRGGADVADTVRP